MLDPIRLIARDPTLRIICIILFLYGTFFSAIGPYQALIAITVFGLPDAVWSVVMLINALVTVAASIGIGIITDQRNNRRAMALICAVFSAAGGLIVWQINTPLAFLLVHLLIWPIGGSIFGQLFALARLGAKQFPADQRDIIMGAVRAIFALAFVVALPFWSAAFASGTPLTRIYPVTMLIAMAVIALILLAWPVPATRVLSSEKTGLSFGASLWEVLTAHILIRLGLLALISAANVLYMAMMGLLFNAAPGRNVQDAALFLTFVTALEVPFMLYMGYAIAHVGRVRLIAFGGVFYGVFLSVFVLAISQWWVWGLALPAALGAALILSVPISYLQDLLAHRPGAGGSLLAVNQVAGAACASGIFALGTYLGNYTTVALIGSASAIGAGIALAIVEIRAGNWKT